MPGAPALDLLPASADRFFLQDFDPTVGFTRDTAGKTDAALLTVGGNTIRCVRK
jgi:hypothetical protein